MLKNAQNGSPVKVWKWPETRPGDGRWIASRAAEGAARSNRGCRANHLRRRQFPPLSEPMVLECLLCSRGRVGRVLRTTRAARPGLHFEDKPEGGDDFAIGDADAGLVFDDHGEAAGVVP